MTEALNESRIYVTSTQEDSEELKRTTDMLCSANNRNKLESHTHQKGKDEEK
jgi:hypothetical protein